MRIFRAVVAIILVLSLTLDVQAIERRRRIVTGCQASSHVPLTIPGLVRWYDADVQTYDDNEAILELVDSSPSNDPAIQANPTDAPLLIHNELNGKKVLRFATAAYMDFTSLTLSSGATVIFVANMVSYADSPGNSNTILSNGAGLAAINLNSDTQSRFGFTAFGSARVYEHPGITTTWHQHMFNTDRVHRLDGSVTDVFADSGSSTAVTYSRIGAALGPLSFVNGDVAEILVYNSVLGTAALNKLGRYLSTKYAISWSDIP